MAQKILISFVGQGQFADSEPAKKFASGYLPANYLFTLKNGEERIVKKHIFVEALLESKQYEFSSIYLLGTSTSSWAMLIYDLAQQDPEMRAFWDELNESCTVGLEDDQRERLEQVLQQKYGLPVYIRTHFSDLDKETIDDVFNVYNTVAEELPAEADILFDVTHGFRTMPLLAYQTLLYNSIILNRRSIEIVYAQLRRAEKGGDPMDPPPSIVRYLGRYWELSEGTVAYKMFKEKYDADLLSRLVSRYCQKLSSPLKRFDEIVRFNVVHNIVGFVKKAREVVEENPFDETWPLWMQDTYVEIVDICNKVGDGRISDQLRNFSRVLHEKNMLVQSIITLRCAFEARVVELDDPSQVGRYDLWKKDGTGTAYERFRSLSISGELKKDMKKLGDLRNEVAHGAGDQFCRGETLNINNLNQRLHNSEEKVDEFFALVR